MRKKKLKAMTMLQKLKKAGIYNITISPCRYMEDRSTPILLISFKQFDKLFKVASK